MFLYSTYRTTTEKTDRIGYKCREEETATGRGCDSSAAKHSDSDTITS